MSYELSLWIQDEKLLKKIMSRLTHGGNTPQVKELLVEMRELILDKKSKELYIAPKGVVLHQPVPAAPW